MKIIEFEHRIGRRTYRVVAAAAQGELVIRTFIEKPKRLRNQETHRIYFHPHEWATISRIAEMKVGGVE